MIPYPTTRRLATLTAVLMTALSALAENNVTTLYSSGVTTITLNPFYVGNGGTNNALLVSNGAIVTNTTTVGVGVNGGSGNRVSVTDPGSVWSVIGTLYSGQNTASRNNTVEASNGATVVAGAISIGAAATADNNALRVGGAGLPSTVVGTGVTLGAASLGNSLTVSNATLRLTGTVAQSIFVGAANGVSNTASVLSGGVWDLNGQPLTVNYNGTAGAITRDNVLWVIGGVVTNVGALYVGNSGASATNLNARLIISDGARVFGTNAIVLGTTGTSGYSTGTVCQIGGAGAVSIVSNWAVTVGNNLGARGQRLTVTNALFTSSALMMAGKTGCSESSVDVRADAVWDLRGGAVTIGALASTTNSVVTVDRGSVKNVAAVSMSGTAGSVTVSNGGQLLVTGQVAAGNGTLNAIRATDGGVLEAGTLRTYAGGNSISSVGGVLQFANASPTITPITFGTIAITNGTVSFRAIGDADVFCNQGATKQLNAANKVQWSGGNAFRLNGASNTVSASQVYTFTTGTATNFCRLELLNGSTYRNGDVTIGTGGALRVGSGTNTVTGSLILGADATLEAVINSAVDCGQVAVQGPTAAVAGTLAVTLGSAPNAGDSFLILTGPVTGTFANTPISATYQGTNYVFGINYTGGVRLTYAGATAPVTVLVIR